MTLAEYEEQILETYLTLYQGNRDRVAQHLGMAARTLRHKIRNSELLRKWTGPHRKVLVSCKQVGRKKCRCFKYIFSIKERFPEYADGKNYLEGTAAWKFATDDERAHFMEVINGLYGRSI